MANQFLNSGASRSVLLDALMDKQNRQYAQQKDPSSIGEALARTGTRLVDAYSQKKLVDDELERRKIGDAATREAYNIIGGGSYNDPSLTGNLTTTPGAIVDGVQMGDVTERTLAPEQQYEPFSNQAYNAALNVNNLTSDVANTLMGQQIRSQEKLNSAQFAPKPIGSTRSVMRPKLDTNGGIINDDNGNPIMEATDVIQIFNPRTNTVEEKIIGPSANVGSAAQSAININEATIKSDIDRKKARLIAEDASTNEQIDQAFTAIGNINSKIRTFDRIITAIDKGASTGVLQGYFKSITDASIELDQLRNEMGLQVIGGTTFGSLSAPELAFALDTALPTDMRPESLKQWVLDRKNGQSKLRSLLTKQVAFLDAGNSKADLLAIFEKENNNSIESIDDVIARNS
jgi:hypothetical protein